MLEGELLWLWGVVTEASNAEKSLPPVLMEKLILDS